MTWKIVLFVAHISQSNTSGMIEYVCHQAIYKKNILTLSSVYNRHN